MTTRPRQLAQQLFVVLDARLAARLTQLSDAPEGSRANPLSPNQEVIGTITGDTGAVEIVVERVERGKSGAIWLFSSKTLDAIPALYEQVTRRRADAAVPGVLFDTHLGGVRLLDWLAVLLGLPVLYFATTLLNRALRPLARLRVAPPVRGVRPVQTQQRPPSPCAPAGSGARESLAASPPAAVAALEGVLGQCGHSAHHRRRRLAAGAPQRRNRSVTSVAGFPRQTVLRCPCCAPGAEASTCWSIFVALLATLRHFGVDPTPALAGLGVGGIAVALAAQKTLENVIAGASLIFDQAVQVGDFLKMGDISGTVDHIGLRSTRIRTLDRTVVSIPNSQIANASLETISARDKFWFHHVVGLRYETTPEQLRAVLDGIRQLLQSHGAIDRESVRVRFLRLGSFSLDVDVFAYLQARDWNHFLEIQEQLLFGVTEIVSRAGTSIAFPSQTMYVANRAEASAPESGSDTRSVEPITSNQNTG